MTNHLRYDIQGAAENGFGSLHPGEDMRRLGITYTHATPQSVSAEWWFWNCTHSGELPPYIRPLDVNPTDAIGYGLSWSDAREILRERCETIDIFDFVHMSDNGVTVDIVSLLARTHPSTTPMKFSEAVVVAIIGAVGAIGAAVLPGVLERRNERRAKRCRS